MDGPYKAQGASQDDVVQTLFSQCTDESGKIVTRLQWTHFLGKLEQHQCLATDDDDRRQEKAFLDQFWLSHSRTGGICYDDFIHALMGEVDVDPDGYIEGLMEDMKRESEDLADMVVSFATASKDEGGRPQDWDSMHETVRQLHELQGAALSKAAAVSSREADRIRLQRQDRLLRVPILAAQARLGSRAGGPATSSGARLSSPSTVPDEMDPRLFQSSNADAIEHLVAKYKVKPTQLTIVSRLYSTAASLGHWLPVSPLLKRRLERADDPAVGGTTTGFKGRGDSLDDSDEAVFGSGVVLAGSACYAIRGAGGLSAAMHGPTPVAPSASDAPADFEVVRCPHYLPTNITFQLYNSYIAHRELMLSEYFPRPCGTFGSSAVPVRDDPNEVREAWSTLPPTFPNGAPAPYVTFVYEAIHGALSLGHLIAMYGPLAETQPCFGRYASDILRAVCDIHAQSTARIIKPLTLENVFVSENGLRVTLGRIEWGRSVEAEPRQATELLLQRSRILCYSVGQMLRALLVPCSGDSQPHPVAGIRAVGPGSSPASAHDAPGLSSDLAKSALLETVGGYGAASAEEPDLLSRLGAERRATATARPSRTASEEHFWPVSKSSQIPSPDDDRVAPSRVFHLARCERGFHFLSGEVVELLLPAHSYHPNHRWRVPAPNARHLKLPGGIRIEAGSEMWAPGDDVVQLVHVHEFDAHGRRLFDHERRTEFLRADEDLDALDGPDSDGRTNERDGLAHETNEVLTRVRLIGLKPGESTLRLFWESPRERANASSDSVPTLEVPLTVHDRSRSPVLTAILQAFELSAHHLGGAGGLEDFAGVGSDDHSPLSLSELALHPFFSRESSDVTIDEIEADFASHFSASRADVDDGADEQSEDETVGSRDVGRVYSAEGIRGSIAAGARTGLGARATAGAGAAAGAGPGPGAQEFMEPETMVREASWSADSDEDRLEGDNATLLRGIPGPPGRRHAIRRRETASSREHLRSQRPEANSGEIGAVDLLLGLGDA